MAENVTKLPAQPGKIDIEFQLGDKLIDGAVLRPLSFATFAEYITEASNMKEPKTFEARMRRIRLSRQVNYQSKGVVVPITMPDVLRMPIPVARKLVEELDKFDEGKPGKIIRDGDGIDQAITFQLGTPIPTGTGKPPIAELEFLAKTYGDVEDVMAEYTSINQTAMLIANIARPLGSSLQQLPSWALNMITVADGVTISRDILPRFLASPDES